MNEQIESAIKQVRAYWFVDGFIEMAAGGIFVLLSVPLLLRGNASPADFPAWLLSVAGEISILKLGGALAAILILWWLKDHFTYPRTGYIRGQRVAAAEAFMVIRNLLLFVLLPILAILAISLLMTPPNNVLAAMPAWFPIGLGCLWAILFAWSGEWMGIRRFRVLAGLALLAGLVIGGWQWATGLPSFPLDFSPGMPDPVVESINRAFTSLALLVLSCGVFLLVSGLVTFLRYRKDNPSPYAEEA